MTKNHTKPLFFLLNMDVIEDLHVGSGTGRGDIDAAVQRDRRGRPVIRASHFKGLLREAGKQLIAVKAGETEDFWPNISEENLSALLGAGGTQRSALRGTSFRIVNNPDSEIDTKRDDTLVWGATARQPENRSPMEGSLRFIEHVAAGTRFQATFRLYDSRPEHLLKIAYLFKILLRRVDRIGGNRNRGSGLVRLAWEEYLPSETSHKIITKGLCLRMVLRNLEPLCIAATGHPGNLIRSHSFIRGQTLRGALMAWLIHHRPSDNVQNDLKLFERLSVGDALPLPEAQTGTVLPIPLSIQTEKPKGENGSALPWWVHNTAPTKTFDDLYTERNSVAEKPKRPGPHEYVYRSVPTNSDTAWHRYSPLMRVQMRNAIPDRDAQKDAELFSVEEIAEDTRFQTELWFEKASDAQKFLDIFSDLFQGDWLTIGHGGRPVIVESIATESPTSTTADQDDWTLLLTSDLILRGPTLGFMDDLDIDTLCHLAGINKPLGSNWTIPKRATDTERLYGFNAASGLRRAPVLALRRGSCWRITGTDSKQLAKAFDLKINSGLPGLGERTEEGCGRFIITTEPFKNFSPLEKSKVTPPEVRNEWLLYEARALAKKITGEGPSLSQLQWLRAQALVAPNENALEKLLADIQFASTRRPQGGSTWDQFPIKHLASVLASCDTLEEKCLLMSYLVKWRVQTIKEETPK